MPQEIITTYGDRRMTLSKGECIRAPLVEGSWSRLRIAVSGSFTDSGGPVIGYPRLAIGVCSGSTNVMVAGSADHVVGGITGSASWGRNPNDDFNQASYTFPAKMLSAFKKVGSTLTEQAPASGTSLFSASMGLPPNVLMIEIAKGSPNYTIQSIAPSGNLGQWNTVPLPYLLHAMLASSIHNAMSFFDFPYDDYVLTTSLPVDEGTDGVLDHIFVYWDRTSPKFTFDIYHNKIA